MIFYSYIENGYKYTKNILDLPSTHCSDRNEHSLNAIDMDKVLDSIHSTNIASTTTTTATTGTQPIRDINILLVSHGGYILRTLRTIPISIPISISRTTDIIETEPTKPIQPILHISRILNGSISIINNTYILNNTTSATNDTTTTTTNNNNNNNRNKYKYIQLKERYLIMKEINVINNSSQNLAK